MFKDRQGRDIRLMGFAISLEPWAWRLGWCIPVDEDDEPAPSFEHGHRWLCFGPIVFMFERPLESETRRPA
jgi:hypothetical protein